MTSDLRARCLCGAVTCRGTWQQDSLRACHCGQCRRWSGHLWAAASAKGLVIDGPVRWFRSSDTAERGFCTTCGSALFWRRIGADAIDVATGAIEDLGGRLLEGHIFVADKGEYYRIGDGLPQYPQEAPE